MVEALVEATARILVREGFDAASTNRIAAAAGVSIGSLYQYFPTKEALVLAVLERHSQALMGIIRDAFVRAEALPLAAGIRELVQAAIDGHRLDPELHRVLAVQVPRISALEDVPIFNRDAYDLFRHFLAARHEQIGVSDLELATFLCVTTIEAVTHTAVLHRSDLLRGQTGDRLLHEATQLVLGYLRAPAAVQATS